MNDKPDVETVTPNVNQDLTYEVCLTCPVCEMDLWVVKDYKPKIGAVYGKDECPQCENEVEFFVDAVIPIW